MKKLIACLSIGLFIGTSLSSCHTNCRRPTNWHHTSIQKQVENQPVVYTIHANVEQQNNK